MIIATGTNKGKIRENNEDFFETFIFNDDLCCLVIADGMGGHNAGQIASSNACKMIIDNVKEFYENNDLNNDTAKECLENALNFANKKLYSNQLTDSKLSGMGTTVVAVIITQDLIHICSAGDSRLYVLGEKLKQITKDHSYVQDLLDKGLITDEQAVTHPNKNIITRALGTEFTLDIDYFSVDKKTINKLIMCTDGLTNLVSDDEIETILKNNNATNANKSLIDLANDNGGRDNITIVNVDFNEVIS